jgi:hypothetical protein
MCVSIADRSRYTAPYYCSIERNMCGEVFELGFVTTRRGSLVIGHQPANQTLS